MLPTDHLAGLRFKEHLTPDELLLNTLRGIASCRTSCPCCAAHVRLAEQVLADYLASQTTIR